MKKLNLRLVLAVICLLLVLVSVISEFFLVRTQSKGVNVDAFQETLWEKEDLAEEYLEGLMDTLKNISGFVAHNEDYDRYSKKLEENGIALMAYRSDSLFVWTDNSIPLPNSYDSVLFQKKFARLDHAWYLIKQVQADSLRLLAAISVKNDYPYQNRFLQNNFQEDFGVSSSVKLVVDLQKGYPIVDRNGEYLFSLVPGKGDLIRGTGLNLSAVLYALSLVVAILFALVFIRDVKNLRLRRWAIVIMGFLLLGLRELMLNWGVPGVFYSMELFSPVLYAASYYFPSLGDFILNALFLFVWVYAFAKYFNLSDVVESESKGVFFFTFGVCLIAIFLLYYLVLSWFKSLVLDSSISFQMYEFSDITIYTFLGFWAIVLLFYSLMLAGDVLIALCRQHCSLIRYYALILIGAGGLSIAGILLIPEFGWVNWLFPIGLLLVHGLIIYRGDPGFRYSLFIILLIGVSAFLVYCINGFSQQKERQDRKIAAMNLATEYDPTSEALLVELTQEMESDSLLKAWCKDPFANEEQILDHIHANYFKGYWDQFQVQVTLCGQRDDLRVDPDGQIRNCWEFFTEMIVESGEQIPGTNFYFLNIFNGMVSYLGVLEFPTDQGREVNIYLRIDSRISNEGLGYPELLLDEKFNRNPMSQRYSYAKYKEDQLIASSGSFNYYLSSQRFNEGDKEYSWVEKDDYDHLVYRFGDNSVVVSTPSLNWYNKFITFPYIFVFFYLFGLIVWLIEKFPWRFKSRFNFKYRIQYSLVGVLMLFFILLGGGSVAYNIQQFYERHASQLGEKLQLVKRELFEDMYSVNELDQSKNPFILDRLRRFSNVIYADINLYDLNGNLIATSRPEIFEKRLLGNKMNYKAYYQLHYQKRSQYIHKENMGNLWYLSAYEPIVDERNQILAYLNLPYFMRNQELQQELFNMVIAGVNLHLLMILLAIFLSVFISNKITYPLKLIQDRFRVTRFGTKSEQINYTKNDEIGSLVQEYNRMLGELEESADRLARSERESAWREMARQIAHEIKNPLTPMKLNIQFLQKSWDDRVPNWDKYLDRVSKTLIEQIDNLSAIATAFSDFARMPVANNERLNLVEVLKNTAQLFRNHELEITLDLKGVTEAFVYVDREQIVRVYVNLLNNAIQSIPEDRTGKIRIELVKEQGKVITAVHDNGTGISEDVKGKLFVPNFTTKSGGMGLGLAIVKNIVENAGGKIWVETQVGEGSSFYVSLPELIEEGEK